VHPSEPVQLETLTGLMDCVFVDAPCTGTGTWRRRPDSKWRIKQGQMEKRMAEQTQILASAAAFVKPGGRMVYATCSFLAEEDEDRVAEFLAAHPEFTEEDAAAAAVASGLLTDEGANVVQRFRMPTGSVRLTPHRAGTDGFFFAVLRRA
jgi:16S rRNA (cytosine967-C5)-methyltransferase